MRYAITPLDVRDSFDAELVNATQGNVRYIVTPKKMAVFMPDGEGAEFVLASYGAHQPYLSAYYWAKGQQPNPGALSVSEKGRYRNVLWIIDGA